MAMLPRETDTVQTVTDPDRTFSLTKDQVAEQLGVSVKTVERMAQRGELQQSSLRGRGRPALYHPADVARILSERRLAASTGFVVPSPDPATSGNGHSAGLARVSTAQTVSTTDDPVRALLTLIGRAVQTGQTGESMVSDSLEEGRWYAFDDLATRKGLTVRGLWKQIRALGLVPFRDGGVWKLRGSEAKRV
jgi:excisionase family DNA binding protein